MQVLETGDERTRIPRLVDTQALIVLVVSKGLEIWDVVLVGDGVDSCVVKRLDVGDTCT